MRNESPNRARGKGAASLGRMILALAVITGCGTATAAPVDDGLFASSKGPTPTAGVVAPVVSGVTPTKDTTPTWSWTSGGGGNGTYRYKLDAFIATGGATETTATTFTAATPLSEGKHTLYVQERDAAGIWSGSGSKAITIKAAVLKAPVVKGPTPTYDTTPKWSWVSGGGGNGTFRYQLDSIDMTGATETIVTSYIPAAPLSEGPHTLYVQERDKAGAWSASGSREVVIDATAPGAPLVSGLTPTNDTTPVWSWVSGGGGNGTFRHNLDSWDMKKAKVTTADTYSAPTGLSEGKHTLYVQERDAAGNWSISGSKAILIDSIPPGAPLVSGLTPTRETMPTWSWVAGGGGIGTFRYTLDSADMAGATLTTALSYTPPEALNEGTHTLYVQECDKVGNWSAAGQLAVEIQSPGTGSRLLNDTGITWYGEVSQNFLDVPPAGFAGQDADFGRDAQARDGLLVKEGGGSGGFDFTKLDDSGNALPAEAVAWSCVRDNHTGLIWEEKGSDGTLRDRDWSYSWYDSDPATNGGVVGTPEPDAGNTCGWTLPQCNTEAYAAAVNNQGLCGATDWRLPKRQELQSLVDRGRTYPSIDTDYFANTVSTGYWSASPYVRSFYDAWAVFFYNGYIYPGDRAYAYSVRLVRGGQ